MVLLQTGVIQKYEASAMNSSDGETVAFIGPTTLDGPVEAWLCDIEKNMRMTLKEELKKCKGNLRRMRITASQIQWTADVTKALGLTKERGDKKALKSLKKKQVQERWTQCCNCNQNCCNSLSCELKMGK